ncbi:pectinesterase-like [Salvia miltiorrhiza]|uniref:pectinesterase-like n=1 Tax=Salvia miltiorrhiza TaxID=226208 RepID=UPI0025AB7797|nr:pectinesterase-like [Salvia miltiorrhiza]
MGDTRNKLTAATALAALLVAAFLANPASAAPNEGGSEEPSKICAGTDYKATCEKSIANANSNQPKDLIKAAFDTAVTELQGAIKNSAAYKKVQSDPMTQKALVVCEEVLNIAIDDLRRSFDKVDQIENGKLEYNIADLRNWLSATVAHKETCIDAFQNTTGDTGEKVKQILKTSSELLSNGLAMISELQKVFSSIDFGKIADGIKGLTGGDGIKGLTGGAGDEKRQLLGDEGDDDEIPEFIDVHARRLMAAPSGGVKADATVAQDGSGQFKTINDAVMTLPAKSTKPFVIFVKAGLYKEYVLIPRGVNNVAIIGEGPLKTRITGDKCVKNGFPTFHSATLTVQGEGFMAKDIAIENTAPESQAVAVRINADMGVFQNVHMDGFQDTLYSHSYRQFYRDCRISGTIDFIFGDAKTIIQNSEIVVRKPLPNQACMVTAQGRKEKKSDGVIVIQGGSITAEKAFLDANPKFEAYLGRPWKEFSRTIIMQTDIGGFINPQGWSPWMGTFALDTLYYGEWSNTGPGADLSKRVKWKGIKKMTPKLAEGFTAQKIFVYDDWIKKTGVPYVGGMLPK